MNSVPKTILTFRNDPDLFELIRYQDGCLGIVRNGTLVGKWEPSQERQCVAIFAHLIGLNNGDQKAPAIPPKPQRAPALGERAFWN
jgi:hypothetical protein